MDIIYQLPFPEVICSKIFFYACKSSHTGLGVAILKKQLKTNDLDILEKDEDIIIFRTYDIRGIVDKEITNALSKEIGKGFGTYVINNDKHTIGVSCDVRPSSSYLLKELIEGLLSTGVKVINFGELPTPVNYYSLHNNNLNIDAAIQITGSHNPSEYNGFKFTFNSTYFKKFRPEKKR